MNDKVKAITLMAGILLMSTGCSSNEDPAPASSSGGGNPAATISTAFDTTTTSANDLRGLTYARVGANSGKIYASGHVGTTPATRQAVVARFNADGTPDNTFGTGGFVQLEATTAEGPAPAGGNDETSIGIAELQSGDVVVTVNAIDADGGQSVYLFRLTPAGVKRANWGDPTTGAVEVVYGWANANNATYPGAVVVPPTFPVDIAWDVQVDRSVGFDRIVVFGIGSAAGGVRTDNDRFITRLLVTATGADRDTLFAGGSGVFTYHSTGVLGDNQRRGSIEADGKIVAAGYTNLGTGIGNHVILIRLNNDGTLDNTFGNFSSVPATLPAMAGVAVFNPFQVNGGAAECYATVRQTIGANVGKYVTTGYGGATGPGMGSNFGYFTTQMPDLVSFRVSGGIVTGLDATWAPDRQGMLAIQSENIRPPDNEERGRHMVVLNDDRTIQVGRYDGNPAYYVMSANGDQRSNIELPHATVNSQFFAAALSPDGSRVAMTTDNNAAGARLVVLNVQ